MADSQQIQTVDLNGLALALYQQQQKQFMLQRQQGQGVVNEEIVDEEDGNEVLVAAVDTDELLINEIRTYRCLWDTKCRAYKDIPKKIEAWRIISTKLGKGGK